MRGPDRAVVLDYVRGHPGTDVIRMVADMYPDASPYDTRYLKDHISRTLSDLRRAGDIIGTPAPGHAHMKLWRAVA